MSKCVPSLQKLAPNLSCVYTIPLTPVLKPDNDEIWVHQEHKPINSYNTCLKPLIDL